jgi:hypothetical protein
MRKKSHFIWVILTGFGGYRPAETPVHRQFVKHFVPPKTAALMQERVGISEVLGVFCFRDR